MKVDLTRGLVSFRCETQAEKALLTHIFDCESGSLWVGLDREQNCKWGDIEAVVIAKTKLKKRTKTLTPTKENR